MRERNRVPAVYETIDMAGIGEKPATRSGPYRLIVDTCAAAIISTASSQLARPKPPLPRWALYVRERTGASPTACPARAEAPVRFRTGLERSSGVPRTYGGVTGSGE